MLLLLFTMLLSITTYSLDKCKKIPTSTPTFYSNQTGNDLSILLKNALFSAKNSIFIAIFSLTDPQIIYALNQQAEKGVQITLIYDKVNSYGISKKLHKAIKSVPIKNSAGIMHRKILIIDNLEIWLGSTNLTRASLHMHDNLLMCLESEEIARAITHQESTGLPLTNHNFNIGDQELELWLLPDPLAKKRLIELIHAASHSIKIAMFTWTDPLLAEAVLKAISRGVHVEIVLDYHSSLGASSKIATLFAEKAAFFGISGGTELFHHKFAYIDGKTLVHGSTNWTRSAFSKNSESHVILPELSKEQHLFFENLWRTLKEKAKQDSLRQKAA